MRNAAPRKGLTLLEVLITIFVMAIGFLSVLTLFPLAARKVARGIDSDRATLMAGNAATSASILGFNNMAQLFANSELSQLPPQDPRRLQPSSVVHVDPAGLFSGSGTFQGSYLMPSNQNQLPANWREWVVSQDELRFESNGLPEQGFRRGERYSASYLFRRRQLNDPDSLECLIFVYTGRPIEFGNNAFIPLNLINDPTNQSGITVTEPGTNGTPGPVGPDRFLGRTSWIMDLSTDGAKPRWKKFYQVQTAELSGVNQLTLTFDRAPEAPITNAVWVDFLFDWFDRGTLP